MYCGVLVAFTYNHVLRAKVGYACDKLILAYDVHSCQAFALLAVLEQVFVWMGIWSDQIATEHSQQGKCLAEVRILHQQQACHKHSHPLLSQNLQ